MPSLRHLNVSDRWILSDPVPEITEQAFRDLETLIVTQAMPWLAAQSFRNFDPDNQEGEYRQRENMYGNRMGNCSLCWRHLPERFTSLLTLIGFSLT